MAWTSWSIQTFLAWKLLGIPLSAHFFLPVHHLLSLIHACCFLFLPLCSLALCRTFWSLWESCGFQRVRKGQPTVLSKAGRGINACYHLSSLLCVNTTGVTVLTPRHLTPHCLYIVLSCSHTHRNAWVTEQMHTLMSSACAHIHTYKNVRGTSVEPLLSDNPSHWDKSRGPADKTPPFPHTSHYRGLFLAQAKTSGGLFSWGKGLCPGERVNCWSGVTQRVERGIQKSFKMTNLPFKWHPKIKPLRGIVGVLVSGCFHSRARFRSSCYSAPVSCPVCPEGNIPGIPRSGNDTKVVQDDPEVDTRPEFESDTASASNFWITFRTDWKGISLRHWPPTAPQAPL